MGIGAALGPFLGAKLGTRKSFLASALASRRVVVGGELRGSVGSDGRKLSLAPNLAVEGVFGIAPQPSAST